MGPQKFPAEYASALTLSNAIADSELSVRSQFIMQLCFPANRTLYQYGNFKLWSCIGLLFLFRMGMRTFCMNVEQLLRTQAI